MEHTIKWDGWDVNTKGGGVKCRFWCHLGVQDGKPIFFDKHICPPLQETTPPTSWVCMVCLRGQIEPEPLILIFRQAQLPPALESTPSPSGLRMVFLGFNRD